MNDELILFHARDCIDVLNDVKEAIADGECDENTLCDLLQHAYHHLNSAWNSRNCDSWDESVERFNEFERFPAVFQERLGAEAAGGRNEITIPDSK